MLDNGVSSNIRTYSAIFWFPRSSVGTHTQSVQPNLPGSADWSLLGQYYASTTQYDGYGRPAWRYSSLSELLSIHRYEQGKDSQRYWQFEGRASNGQLNQERYGNGIGIHHSYDSTGRPRELQHGQLLYLSTDYDASGNIKRERGQFQHSNK